MRLALRAVMQLTWPTTAQLRVLSAATVVALGGGCASSHEVREAAAVDGELCVSGWIELGYGQSIVARRATPDGPGEGVTITLSDDLGDDRLSTVTTVDVDGDGRRDVVVRSAYGGAAVLDEPISLTVFLGAVGPFEDRERLAFVSDAHVTAGGDVAALGDWDGDARADLVAGWDGSVILTGAEMREVDDACVRGAGVGDVDGDGVPDSACVGADGAVELLLGGRGAGGAPDNVIRREASASTIAPAGDVNGDGRADIAIRFEDGSAELISGADPTGPALAISSSVYGWTALGDVDGDGIADLAAHRSHGAFLVRGSRDAIDAEGEEIVSIGDTPRTVLAAGDADCDGLADVLVITGGTVELRRGGPAGVAARPAWTFVSERRSLVPIYD